MFLLRFSLFLLSRKRVGEGMRPHLAEVVDCVFAVLYENKIKKRFFRTEIGCMVGFKLSGIEYKSHKLSVVRADEFVLEAG